EMPFAVPVPPPVWRSSSQRCRLRMYLVSLSFCERSEVAGDGSRFIVCVNRTYQFVRVRVVRCIWKTGGRRRLRRLRHAIATMRSILFLIAPIPDYTWDQPN